MKSNRAGEIVRTNGRVLDERLEQLDRNARAASENLRRSQAALKSAGKEAVARERQSVERECAGAAAFDDLMRIARDEELALMSRSPSVTTVSVEPDADSAEFVMDAPSANARSRNYELQRRQIAELEAAQRRIRERSLRRAPSPEFALPGHRVGRDDE
jgi:hypothetical protein